MGRKGVSKRKPARKKVKQLGSENGGRGVSSASRAATDPLDKLPDIENAVVPTIRGSKKNTPDPKKSPKKRKLIGEI